MDNNNLEKPFDDASAESKNTQSSQNSENNSREQDKPRIKDVRNPVITEENFVKDAENAVPPLAWKDQKKAYDDAWENNRNQQLDDI
ncbi:MAG: hypothetical protein L6264_08755 [Weeksellaceae bacterium]|nr:hypothetical protein [Bacteroidota bacterium]MCG2781027.1 hypothetical protein [Weeksellaceae bacterium]